MYTVSILASPVRADLDDDTIIALQRRWGGGRALWLDHGTAAEFPVETPPEDFDPVWAELDARGFDLAVQATAGRRKAVLLADMAGVGPRVAAITARAMNGELDFHES
ncbi:MAG TPA: phosphoserine phosphatase SerB, partial [Paracoccus sp.]|nr:phosphoserine phosphatase SerB [Paracoccus sp. (in: a-proteobacteria)]